MVSLGGAVAGGAVVNIIIRGVDQFSSTFASAGAKMKGVGKLAMVGGATIAGGLGLAVKEAISFESAFTGVEKTVNLSADEFEDLKNRFKDLTTEVPKSFQELSAIGEIAGQLGVEGVDNIELFTKTVSMISDTTNLTAEEAATDFARLANIMGSDISEVEKYGSAVVGLGNNFATNESDILGMTMRIAGAGKTIGLSEDQLFGYATAMSSVGIQAEMGGSAFSKMMVIMGKATASTSGEVIDNTKEMEESTVAISDLETKLSIARQKMEEWGDTTKESTRMAGVANIDKLNEKLELEKSTLEALSETQGQTAEEGAAKLESFAAIAGVSAEEFAKVFEDDASGAIQMFINGLGDMKDGGEDVFSALDSVDLGGIRTMDTFLRLAGASGVVNDALAVSAEETEKNTALTEEAQKRYDDFAEQLIMVKNEFMNMAAEIGNVLIPLMQDYLIPAISKITEWFSGLSEGQKKWMVIGTALAAVLLVVVGALLLIIPAIYSTVVAVMAMNIALGPIILVILAIALVIGIVIGIFLRWTEIVEFAKVMFSIFLNYLKLWAVYFKVVWEGVKLVFATLWNTIITIAEGAVNQLIKVLDPFLTFYNFVQKKLGKDPLVLKADFSGAMIDTDAMKENIKDLGLEAVTLVKDSIDLGKKGFGEFKEIFTGNPEEEKTMTPEEKASSMGITSVGGTGQTIINNNTNNITTMYPEETANEMDIRNQSKAVP